MRARHLVRFLTAATILVSGSSGYADESPPGLRVVRPDGTGARPTAVFMSGCSGFVGAGYTSAATKLKELGYVVAHVDYVGKRTTSGNCATAKISKEAAATDLSEAITWLKAQDFVEKGKVLVIGWSYGAGSTLYALSKQLPISMAILYYPDCSMVPDVKSELPILVLQGSADNVVSNTQCRELIARSSSAKSYQIEEFPGALHAFDMSNLPAQMQYPFGTIGYSKEAELAAWNKVLHFLAARP